ncbi:MAG: AAA family ATPase [Dolichospermum sp.]|jgi:predicted ATP-binding protein involved in virulence
MKIRQLELQNFRCFDQKTFDFSDQFNVLIGDNGSDKIAILKALSTGAIVILFVPEIPTRDYQIDQDDIRHITAFSALIRYKVES